MYLKYIKEISEVEQKCLKEISEILAATNKLEDAEFLRRDYALFKSMPKPNSFFLIEDFALKLKPLLQPEYEIFDRFGKEVYQKFLGERIKRGLYLVCGKEGGYDEAALHICEAKGAGNIFYLGRFLPEEVNLMTGYRDNTKVIATLARYFFNRQATYREIYKLLITNQEKLTTIFGKAFLEDLISLFSVEAIAEAPTFKLPSENLEHQILGRKVKRRETFFLGTAFYQPANSTSAYTRLQEIKIELWLTQQKQLIIDVIPKEQYYQSSLARMQELERVPDFKEFLTEGINLWLAALALEANFIKALYQKNKTKILLANI